jgi:hypothetical protein
MNMDAQPTWLRNLSLTRYVTGDRILHLRAQLPSQMRTRAVRCAPVTHYVSETEQRFGSASMFTTVTKGFGGPLALFSVN